MRWKWCAFTGALMCFFVFAAQVHQVVHRDPPGVTTRWWDGTKAKEEQFWPDGKPRSLILYGEDGQSRLVEKEWSEDGALVFSSLRLEDGTVEEKRFTDDGKTLLRYVLWNGDGQSYRIMREFSDSPNTLGVIEQEEIRTEDGSTILESREYSPPGVLYHQHRIIDNGWADQEDDYYEDGKITRSSILRGSGDRISIVYWPNEKMRNRLTQFNFDGGRSEELFDQDGLPVESQHWSGGNSGNSEKSVFDKGKLKYKESYEQSRLMTVEEYSTDTGKLLRKFVRDGSNIRVEHYREDGTVAQVKELQNGKTVRQIDYDASGKTVVHDKPSGDAEPVPFDELTTPERRGQ